MRFDGGLAFMDFFSGFRVVFFGFVGGVVGYLVIIYRVEGG